MKTSRLLPSALLLSLAALGLGQTPAGAADQPNAWQIADTSASGVLSYTNALTPAQRIAATNQGWRFSVVSRLLSGGATPSQNMIYGNGTRRFAVVWNTNADGALIATLPGTNLVPVLTPNGEATNGYHTHELVYDPISTNATYLVDGNAVLTWPGEAQSAQAGTILWGANASAGLGRVNYQRVQFAIHGLGTVSEYNAGLAGSPLVAPSPVTQGWFLFTNTAPSVTLTNFPVSPDAVAQPALKAWQITDNVPTANTSISYTTNLTPALVQTATNGGWRYAMTSRLVDDFGATVAMFMVFGDGTRRHGLGWDFNPAKDTLVVNLLGGGTTNVVVGNAADATAYHTHELIRTNGVVNYFFDGQFIANSLGDTAAAQSNQVFWGSAAGGGQGQVNFHRAEFWVNGPGRVAAYNAGNELDPDPAPSPTTQGWTRNQAGIGVTEAPVSEAPVASGLIVTNVNDSGAGSLRSAIASAAAGDSITFAPALNGQAIVLTSGDLIITKDLSILGPGATNLSISGNASNRVFYVTNGVTCTVAGLTVTNGLSDAEFPTSTGLGGSGGGILNRGFLTVSNAAFRNNRADKGGGGGAIHNYPGATLTVHNCTLSRNSATYAGSGGGLHNAAGATATVINSVLSNNAVDLGANAGGIFNSGTLNLQSSTLSGNRVAANGDGGGILNRGTLTVQDSTVSGNQIPGVGHGAGILNTGTLTVLNSTVSGNTVAGAGNGGGIYNPAGTLRVQNSTLSGNSAASSGGGIYNLGTATIQNCTLTANRGGIFDAGIGGLHAGGTERLTNNIVAGSLKDSSGTPSDIGGGTVDAAAFNLVGSTNGVVGITNGINGNLVGNAGVGPLAIAGILNTSLALNGGPTRTHALAPGSPALNAGTNVASLPASDQRGPGFARLVGGTVDLGAYELQPPPVITCPDNIVAECTGGLTPVNFTVTATNNLGPIPVTCVPPSGTGFPLGTSNVVCSAASGGLTATCSFTVTVVDSPPVLVGVPPNANYQCLDNVPAPPVVTANSCRSGPLTPTLVSVTNGTCPTIIIRTWTATDAAGNSTTRHQTNTVHDTTPPVFSGLPSLTVACFSDVLALPPATATDNCDGVIVATSLIRTNSLNPLVLQLSWAATDRCTNRASIAQFVTVLGSSASTITVTSSSDSGPGSLRDALANICSGGTITFAPALNGQIIVLTSGELVINKSLSILGPGAGQLAISGNDSSRVFFVSSNNPPIQATIADLAIERGNGVSALFSRVGGGIFNHSGALTLRNCILRGHTAAGGGSGGAVFNNRGALTILNCTFHGNSSGFGGGIYNAAGELTIWNSTLSGNTASNSGGAVAINAGTVALANSTLSGNSAGNLGGGIYNNVPTRLSLENSIIAGNTSSTAPDIRSLNDALVSDGYNFIGSTNGIANAATLTDLTFASTGTTLDQLLQTSNGQPLLTNNGGATPTIALVLGSPARNAGTNVAGLPAYDQRGPGFPRVAEGRVDIGAYELDCGNQGGPPYFGDVNADGLTFLDDFATLRGNFGATGAGRAGGNLDGDGDVDAADYVALRNNFGHAAAPCYPIFTPPTGIPYAGYSGLSLRLLLDGTVEIVNLGANPVAMAGYSLFASNSVLNPGDWRSLNALAGTNVTYLTNALGAGAASFNPANPTSQLLSELNLGGVATFAPGSALELGRAYAGSINVTNEVRFFYMQDGVVREGAVNRAPVAIPDDSRSLRAGDTCVANVGASTLNFQSFDFDGDPLTYGVTPPGPYPIGSTEGFFWAIDHKGASNGTSILISVVDAAPPRFTNCPNVELVAALPPGSNTVQVFFEAGAEDSCSPNVSVSCNYPSGSYFPIGETEVRCTAFAPGGTDDCRFVVRVAAPEFSVGTLGLPPVSFGAAAWGDYDNDGWLDLVLSGGSTNGYITQIWRNQGNNTFSNINAGLPGLNVSAAAWGDVDNDGRLDLAIAGSLASGQRLTQIWRNTGSGFVNLNAGITGVDDGALAWGDYDNDGRIDLLLTGVNGPRVAQVWRNTGSGFVNINANLPGVSTGGAAWGDFDHDGRLDILLSGFDSGGGRKSVLWRNTGSGFAEVDSALPGVTASSVAWADYDNDGWLDLAIAGNAGNQSIAQVWRNTGGSFSNINATLPGVSECSVAWGDYDNDGKPDLLLTGTQRSGGPLTQIWRNNETNFVVTPSGLAGVRIGKGAWADYNNDGRLDVVLMGQSLSGPVTQIWRNNTPGAINTVPAPPTGLRANPTATSVDLRWTAAADGQTPSPGLSYNVAIGTSAGGISVLGPEANLPDGWRRLPALGNAQLGTNATLALPPGTYFWAVQAIDGAWAGGPFADGGSFVVGNTVEVRITAFERRSPTQFWLRFTGAAGASYRVEWSENLTTWNDLGAPTVLAPGVFEYLDTGASIQRRFYRATKP